MSRKSSGSENGPLNLRRERSCIDDLLWRCDLPEEIDPETLATALEERGWCRRGESSSLPLWVYSTPEEHRILIVPATRRLQLRIHYGLPKPRRAGEAKRLADLLRASCRVDALCR